MKRFFAIVMTIVLLAAVFSGCRRVREKAAENAAERIMEKAMEDQSGGKADVDINADDNSVSIKTDEGELTIQSGEDMEWPQDLKGKIPELKGIKIVGMMNQMGSIVVTFEGADMDGYEEYKSQLEADGFTISMDMKYGEGGGMLNAQKGNQVVVFSVDEEGNGGLTYTEEE
jgi:hypothetical protein